MTQLEPMRRSEDSAVGRRLFPVWASPPEHGTSTVEAKCTSVGRHAAAVECALRRTLDSTARPWPRPLFPWPPQLTASVAGSRRSPDLRETGLAERRGGWRARPPWAASAPLQDVGLSWRRGNGRRVTDQEPLPASQALASRADPGGAPRALPWHLLPCTGSPGRPSCQRPPRPRPLPGPAWAVLRAAKQPLPRPSRTRILRGHR